MNYSGMRRAITRDLRWCTLYGLPAWARIHIEERVEYAAHWWCISKDHTKSSDFRRDSYVKATRVQLGVLKLLSDYRVGDDGAKAFLACP